MSHHENPGAAGTAAGRGGAQSEPDAYAHDSKNAQRTKARTLAKGGLSVSPCKLEIFGDKPKRPFTDHSFGHATTNSACRLGEATHHELIDAGRNDAVQQGARTLVLVDSVEHHVASPSRATPA